MQRLIEEVRRLFILKGQVFHEQSKDGESYFPAGALTPGVLEQHFKGERTIALNLVSEEGLVRAFVIDFDGVAHGKGAQHWQALCQVAQGLQERGLPAPAVSVSGRKGYGLWLSLETPVPAALAQQFLHLVRKAYLQDLPKEELDLRPDTDKPTKAALAVAKLPPCLHRASGNWAAFIKPEMGSVYEDTPYLDFPPPLEAQAQLLAGVQSATNMQFMQALAQLQKEYGAEKADKGPSHKPNYGNTDKRYLPPCISSLVKKGVPHEMQYNVANVNLYAYCHSAGLEEDAGLELAQEMAQASETHPSSKGGQAKVKNYASNRNTPKEFFCDFARNTPAWAKQYGGASACQGCKLSPGFDTVTSDKQTSQTQDSSPILEAPVALDLLAYARGLKEGLPQIRYVWPSVKVDSVPLPWYALAAQSLQTGGSSSAFFGLVDKHLSELRNSANQRSGYRESAVAFFTQLQAHQATQQAGREALERATHLERRLSLTRAVGDAMRSGPEVAANVVATQLRSAAEATLVESKGSGPLIGLRNELFESLARRVSNVIPTPFPRLNGLLHGGLRGGRLYTLLAPPKAGKTTLAATLQDYAASLGYPCLYVGYEMAREQMVEYSVARQVRINSGRIETRDLSEQEAERVASGLEEYLAGAGQYLEIWEAGLSTSLADMQAWVIKAKATHPDKTPLVVIDYLQLAYTGIPEIDRHPSETKRVSEVAVACKHLARQTGAAVLALSSVTKAAETDSRSTGEIDVTAARDSLAIIHASDGVLALQTATVTVTEGKGESKSETELDPWGFLADQLRRQGQEANAVTLERALTKADKDGYGQGGYPGYGIRARLSLLRHRGSTGEVALYYRRAFHQIEEVELPGLSALEQGANNPDISINVFQKYINKEAPHVQQDSLPGFEPEPTPEQKAIENALTIDFSYEKDREKALAAIAGLAPGVVGVDLETTGLSPITAQARLLQLSDGEKTLVIDLWTTGGLPAFKQALEPLHLVAHNAVFEMGFFYKAGIEVTLDCTMLAAHVLTGKREKLKALASQYLGLGMDKAQQVSDWSAEALTQEQLAYAALDALAAQQIFTRQREELAQRDSERAYSLARDAQPSVVRMELAGMPFNAQQQRELIATLTVQRDKYAIEIQEQLGGINPNSGTQLSAWITSLLGGEESEKYKLWPKTTSGKALRTGADDLKKCLVYLPDAQAALIRDTLLPLKEVEKKLSAFGQSLVDKINPVTQRIHADFNLAGAETGRMSCSGPNLQQIPRDKEYRALFAAPEGRAFAICDYSQMELRVAAQLANETSLIEAYRQGLDTHKKTAALLLNKAPEDVTKAERQLAKAVNFGLLFGQGPKGLQAYAQSSYGVTITEEQARTYRNAWFDAYPAFRAWHSKTGRAAEKALAIRTPAGRERRWASAKDFSVTMAYNTPVQGGAAEAMLAALAHLETALKGLDAFPIAVVHDELIVECEAGIAQQVVGLLEQAMVQGFRDIFPEAPVVDVVEGTVGATWADK